MLRQVLEMSKKDMPPDEVVTTPGEIQERDKLRSPNAKTPNKFNNLGSPGMPTKSPSGLSPKTPKTPTTPGMRADIISLVFEFRDRCDELSNIYTGNTVKETCNTIRAKMGLPENVFLCHRGQALEENATLESLMLGYVNHRVQGGTAVLEFGDIIEIKEMNGMSAPELGAEDVGLDFGE